MTFRARLAAAFLPAVLVPLVVFGWGVRGAVGSRLQAMFTARADAALQHVRARVTGTSVDLARRLAGVRRAAASDAHLRAALAGDSGADYVRDFAGTAMRVSGLASLQVLSPEGTVLSSGHFRNSYGSPEPALEGQLRATSDSIMLLRVRSAESTFVTLARLDSLRVGDRVYPLVGGIGVDSEWMARSAPDTDVTVVLDDTAAAGGHILPLPFLASEDADAVTTASLVVRQSLGPLAAISGSVDRWLILGLLTTALTGLALALWLAGRLSKPLADLTDRAEALDPEHPEGAFDTGRRDEVGKLAGVLSSMTSRLKEGAEVARRAERRAALGDLARQVNHDIRNGLTPIRNVFRHWSDAAGESPAELARVFAERQGTVESSITYLNALAGEYARLAVPGAAEPCDLNAAVQGAAQRLAGDEGITVQVELADPAPVVRADPLALRRVIDNLASNARESLVNGRGRVTLRTKGGEHVCLQVIDTGAGMSSAELERALVGFHSTKPQGSGLGLTIVRRLVSDAGGALRVDTAPGAGSSFTVEFPRLETAGAAAEKEGDR
ncbi:MAG TPA: HAMP domain-containing sensor histidine kinase [Gemmatimonadales bacterium]|nr:HAMP domain-containing sensor histidine kinase [Gemmatimonadales bacterium]